MPKIDWKIVSDIRHAIGEELSALTVIEVKARQARDAAQKHLDALDRWIDGAKDDEKNAEMVTQTLPDREIQAAD